MATNLTKLEMFAGNSRTLKFTVNDLDTDPTGATPKNLTGLIVQWALTRQKNGKVNPTPVVVKSSPSNGVTITGALTGQCEVALVEADTDALLGDFYQELELDDGLGNTLVVATGAVLIKLNVENP